MDATVLPSPRTVHGTRARGVALALSVAPVVLIAAAGAMLRLWSFDRVGANPFYDAAVRSMSLSWHNFFFGAFEPGGQVSVDKVPADLWLQGGVPASSPNGGGSTGAPAGRGGWRGART